MGILLIFSSCMNSSVDLGDGYVVDYNTGDLDRVVMIKHPSGGILINSYDSSHKVKSRYCRNEDWIINSYVNKSSSNKNFTLIERIPIEKICECNFECLEKKYPEENRKSYELCSEALRKSSLREYYVIDKRNNFLYGPMTLNEFRYFKNKNGIKLGL